MISNMGVPGVMLLFNIIFGIVGLFILYKVISTAVKDGINKSEVGKYFEKRDGVKEGKKSFLDSDLDNNK